MNAMLIFLLIVGMVIFFVFMAIESYKASDLGDDKNEGSTRQNEYARYMFYLSITLTVLTTLAAIGFAYSKFDDFSNTLKGIKTATIGGDDNEGGGSSSSGSPSKKSGGAVKWNEWKVKNGASSLKVTADRIEGSKDAWIKLPNGSELKVNAGIPFKQGGPAEWDVTVPGDTNEGFITLTVGEPGPYQYKEMLQVNGEGKLVHTNPIRPARAPSGLSSGVGYASRPARSAPILPGSNASNPLTAGQFGVPTKGYQQQQQQQQKKSLGNQFNQPNQPNQFNQPRNQQPNQFNQPNNPFEQNVNPGLAPGGGYGGNQGGGGYGNQGGGGGGITMNDFTPNRGGISIADPAKTSLANARGTLPNFGKKNKVTVHQDGYFHMVGPGNLDYIGPRAI